MLLPLAAALGILSLLFLVGAGVAVRRRRWIGSLGSAGTGALFLALAALAATLSVSTQGYRALTMEEVAATVTTVPTGPRSFQAYVEFADGREETFAVPLTPPPSPTGTPAPASPARAATSCSWAGPPRAARTEAAPGTRRAP
jgi:hypothetical protein